MSTVALRLMPGLGLACAVTLALTPTLALAQSTIKRPGDHPKYVVEVEPHALFGIKKFGPFDDHAFGAGIRLSFPIVQNGFVKSINNSVAITFGGDILFSKDRALIFPVAMQWNFFVHNHWSVFGEPGFAVSHELDGKKTLPHPVLWAGARYHFTEHVTLTMRVGYPTFSIGVSFM
jgi:hypothetical protein